jgi:hypothetical protein
MIHVHNWLTLWLLPTLQRFLSPLRWSKAAATMRLSKLEMITVTWPRFLMGFDLNRFLGFHGITLWLCQNSYWKWPFIVDLPKMVIFHRYVSLPEGTISIRNWCGTLFFRFWGFFGRDLLFCPFSLQFAEFGAGSCDFNGIGNILEFEPLSFHDICNILVLKLCG